MVLMLRGGTDRGGRWSVAFFFCMLCSCFALLQMTFIHHMSSQINKINTPLILFFVAARRQITTTAEITIYAEPNFDLIVTAQEIGINTFAVDPSDPNADAGTASMTVTFTTLLQTPFELSSLDARTGGEGTAPTTATVSTDSPVVGTNTVRQPGHQFTYEISTPSNPCDFSLTYDLKGTVGCGKRLVVFP